MTINCKYTLPVANNRAKLFSSSVPLWFLGSCELLQLNSMSFPWILFLFLWKWNANLLRFVQNIWLFRKYLSNDDLQFEYEIVRIHNRLCIYIIKGTIHLCLCVCALLPWPYLWTDFEIKGTTYGLPMTQGWLEKYKILKFRKIKKKIFSFSKFDNFIFF